MGGDFRRDQGEGEQQFSEIKLLESGETVEEGRGEGGGRGGGGGGGSVDFRSRAGVGGCVCVD